MKRLVAQLGVGLVVSLGAMAHANCHGAHEAFTAGKMSKKEYHDICNKEKEAYRERMNVVRRDFLNGRIKREEYEKRLDAIEKERRANN